MLALVVDDDQGVRSLAVRSLERAGIVSLSFSSGDDAMAALGSIASPPALVVTDVSMPGAIDGLALARGVTDRWPEVPVIVMSGCPDSLEAAHLQDGVTAVLAKPFSPRSLAVLARRATRGTPDPGD